MKAAAQNLLGNMAIGGDVTGSLKKLGSTAPPIPSAKRAAQTAERTRRAYLESAVGKTLPVLFETQENGMWQGHSDTYVLVRAEGEKLRGTVKSVEITDVSGEILVGKII